MVKSDTISEKKDPMIFLVRIKLKLKKYYAINKKINKHSKTISIFVTCSHVETLAGKRLTLEIPGFQYR